MAYRKIEKHAIHNNKYFTSSSLFQSYLQSWKCLTRRRGGTMLEVETSDSESTQIFRFYQRLQGNYQMKRIYNGAEKGSYLLIYD